MFDYKPLDTSVVENLKLGELSTLVPANKERYQWLVRKFVYLSHSRYMEAVFRILR